METLKKLLCAVGLFLGVSGWSQECPARINPLPGDTDVPVDVTLVWEQNDSVPGYAIELGTEPGGNDILSTTVGGSNSLDVTRIIPGLPEDTLIWFTITLLFPNQTDKPDIRCEPYSFRTESFTAPPECTVLSSPADGATNVPVEANLNWEYRRGASAYRIFAGTTPGGTDLLDNVLVTDALFLNPPENWPPNTDVFVRIIPENESFGGPSDCREFQFRTAAEAALPDCATMVYPQDEAFNVSVLPTITWNEVDGAEGYYVSLDTSPFFDDEPVLNRVVYSSPPLTISEIRPLEFNTVYFLRIVPFNATGEAQNCEPITFYTILGCGPYLDEEGNLIDNAPELNFPEAVGICSSGPITPITATDPADGYRWYKIENENREFLVGQGPEFIPPGEGLYRLEIFNELLDSGISVICPSSQVFTVTQSEPATVESTDVDLGAGALSIEVTVSGIGDYEFALNDPEGPYQESNRFTGLPLDDYRVYVRDRKGCGITEVLVQPDLTLEGFPKFFTPNGDGINDFWQFILPPSGINPIRQLFVFDRYGNLLAQVDPQSAGWDGTFNGRPMPASDYWFRAIDDRNQEVRGHFSLKR